MEAPDEVVERAPPARQLADEGVGVERGGWRLAYDPARGQRVQDLEDGRERVEMAYSLGLRLDTEGLVGDVLPGGPAAKAGLGPGMTVVAVDGRAYTPDVLRDAVAASKSRPDAPQLLVNNEGTVRTFALDYHGGERYPRLTRDASKPDLLTQIIKPLTDGRVGVAECDGLIDKYERCVTTKVPAAAQPTFRGSVETWRKSWRELASTSPQVRAYLARTCLSSSEQARASLKGYGCAF